MPRGKFEDLVAALPEDSRRRIAEGVREAVEGMPLAKLREARSLTQTALSSSMGVSQSEVSKREKRTDTYVSTLAGYVEAMGGKLEIRAVFPQGQVRITQFDLSPSPAGD